jgi:hypothetical protein
MIMPKNDNEQQLVTIQTKVTEDQYAALMRAKANSKNPRQSRSDFYRERLMANISN